MPVARKRDVADASPPVARARVGYLRFSIDHAERAPIHVGIAVDGALAIAEQLREAISNESATNAAMRRPPAKRRADDEN
jgi:hypothetical protein